MIHENMNTHGVIDGVDFDNPDNCYPWELQPSEEVAFTGYARCRGCDAPLYEEQRRIADGCVCNSPRGINHGLVPKNTCTCPECDPAQTGSTRYPVNT